MTLLIKQGRRYVRRDGKIAGPMEPNGSFHFPWYDPVSDNSYKPNGNVWTNHQVDNDLLTEFEEPSESETVAGEAYQIIGDLAVAANLYDHPEVQRALDWFSGFEPGVTYKDDASILPWPREELKPDDYSALTARIKVLEEENKELRAALILARGFIWSGGSTIQALANIASALAKKDSTHA